MTRGLFWLTHLWWKTSLTAGARDGLSNLEASHEQTRNVAGNLDYRPVQLAPLFRGNGGPCGFRCRVGYGLTGFAQMALRLRVAGRVLFSAGLPWRLPSDLRSLGFVSLEVAGACSIRSGNGTHDILPLGVRRNFAAVAGKISTGGLANPRPLRGG